MAHPISFNFDQHIVDNVDELNNANFRTGFISYGKLPVNFELGNPIRRDAMLGHQHERMLEKERDIYDPFDSKNDKEIARISALESEVWDRHGDAMVLNQVLGRARANDQAVVDYYPELRNVLNSDVVIKSARNPRRERMAGLAIAGALGLLGGGAAMAGYNSLNQANQSV